MAKDQPAADSASANATADGRATASATTNIKAAEANDARVVEMQARLASLEEELASAKSSAADVDALKAQLVTLQTQVASGQSAKDAPETILAERASFRQVRSDDKVKIVIATSEGEDGKQPVFVSVNGLGYYIPRDSEEVVPRCVYENLRNATITDWTLVEGRPIDGREVPRYNIQVIL